MLKGGIQHQIILTFVGLLQYWFNWNVTSNEICLILEDYNQSQVAIALLHWLIDIVIIFGSITNWKQYVHMWLPTRRCTLPSVFVFWFVFFFVWLKVNYELDASGRYIKAVSYQEAFRSPLPSAHRAETVAILPEREKLLS